MATIGGVVVKFYDEYTTNTPKKLKIIDAYLAYILFTGIFQVITSYTSTKAHLPSLHGVAPNMPCPPLCLQFLYCCLVGTFPFNAFLSGFISSVASFVLGVCLRLQVCCSHFLMSAYHHPGQPGQQSTVL